MRAAPPLTAAVHTVACGCTGLRQRCTRSCTALRAALYRGGTALASAPHSLLHGSAAAPHWLRRSTASNGATVHRGSAALAGDSDGHHRGAARQGALAPHAPVECSPSSPAEEGVRGRGSILVEQQQLPSPTLYSLERERDSAPRRQTQNSEIHSDHVGQVGPPPTQGGL